MIKLPKVFVVNKYKENTIKMIILKKILTISIILKLIRIQKIVFRQANLNNKLNKK
jgi:hypothetical protein